MVKHDPQEVQNLLESMTNESLAYLGLLCQNPGLISTGTSSDYHTIISKIRRYAKGMGLSFDDSEAEFSRQMRINYQLLNFGSFALFHDDKSNLAIKFTKNGQALRNFLRARRDLLELEISRRTQTKPELALPFSEIKHAKIRYDAARREIEEPQVVYVANASFLCEKPGCQKSVKLEVKFPHPDARQNHEKDVHVNCLSCNTKHWLAPPDQFRLFVEES